MAFEKQLQVLLKDRKNSCRTTDSKLQKCSEFQGWRFARSHEFVGTISGATSRSPKRWGTRGWAWAPTATSYAYARCVNETTYLVSCPKKQIYPQQKSPNIQESMILFGDSDRFSMAVFVHLNWPDWYNVRPPLDSVQLVQTTPISLWFMVRK